MLHIIKRRKRKKWKIVVDYAFVLVLFLMQLQELMVLKSSRATGSINCDIHVCSSLEQLYQFASDHPSSVLLKTCTLNYIIKAATLV